MCTNFRGFNSRETACPRKLVHKEDFCINGTHLFDTIKTAIYNHPLVQQKPVLNSRWFVKPGSLRHAMQSQPVCFPQIRNGGIFPLAAVYTHILHICCSKCTQKVVPSLHKPTTTRYMCTLLWSQALCVQNLVVTSHVWQVVLTTETFLYKIIHAWS